ncbi:MAG TPA: F0F1 ATP synthase subunit epsilon [Phycisphaerae bacterium]|nr:F0F1 ATP synthase subunit epsilon [Phycisphaerae bacterium]
MPSYRRPFRCEVITPTGRAFAGEFASAVFPALDGLVGVLGGRGPLVMLLGSGPLTVREMDGAPTGYFLAGGFARFRDNVLTLLTAECLPLHEIDPEAAWREIQQATALPRETPEAEARREEALKAARDKFNLAQKHRKETEGI